jgi:hypothetical protein
MTMHSRQHERDGRHSAVAGGVSLAVLAVGLAVTAANVPMAWLVWPLGYGVVLPLAIGYAARRERADQRGDDSARDQHDPVSDLHDRYVAGDIDEREFERELEAALEGENR